MLQPAKPTPETTGGEPTGQFGADPAKADDKNTVNNFRTDCLRELKKIKMAWPGLNYATAPGVLILWPSKPAVCARAASARGVSPQVLFSGPESPSAGVVPLQSASGASESVFRPILRSKRVIHAETPIHSYS